MQGFSEFTEEKKIVVKTKMGGEIPATIKVTGKDYHIVKTDSGKQYKVDHQGNSLEEEIELTLEDYSLEEIEAYMQTEEFEQLDELDKSTLKSYFQKSQKSSQNILKKAQDPKNSSDDAQTELKRKFTKRLTGMARAAQKFNKEEIDDKDVPFTPDKKPTKPSTPGKYGSAYSTVRNLARKALEKQAKKLNKEEGGKICVGEEALIEKLDKKEELRAALNRHSEKAVEANKRGDDEAVKVHQNYMNKIKDKMAKLARNEEVELEETNKGYAPGWMLKADPELAKKVKAHTQGYKDLKKYAGKDIPKNEEVEIQESSDAHKVMVTVSDPHHTAVSQRKEQIMKHVIVRAGDKGEAQAKAEAFYKKRGYKVHGSEYHSKQPATSMKTEGN